MASKRNVLDHMEKITKHLDMLTKCFIPLDIVRRFARKTRDYLNVYEEMMAIALAGNVSQEEALVQAQGNCVSDVISYAAIQRMIKVYKCHRNIYDQEMAVINSS